MSYHRSPYVRRTRRQQTALDGVLDSFLDMFGITEAKKQADATAALQAQTGAASSTFVPANADQKAKLDAGCTPIEIVASPGTSPYVSCQNKVAKAAGGASSGGGGISDSLAKLLGALVANQTGASSPAVPMVAPSSGISTGTLLVGGAAALAVLYLAMKD